MTRSLEGFKTSVVQVQVDYQTKEWYIVIFLNMEAIV